MCLGSGLCLLDEAEGPLSFQSTLALLYQLQDLSERQDTQVIYFTHGRIGLHCTGLGVRVNDPGSPAR